jgi:hypothetical protein
VPGALTAFLDGSRFFGGDPWLKTIAECAPLFLPPVRDPWTDIHRSNGPSGVLGRGRGRGAERRSRGRRVSRPTRRRDRSEAGTWRSLNPASSAGE